MSSQRYKNIGKKQIIDVLSQVIHKVESIEVTLNLFIVYMEKVMKEKDIIKGDKFSDFMKKQLGGKDELQSDDKTDGGGDNSESSKDKE
tara:strand:+ start:2964 stop:3230 length:267 start_codon:yes stop_codon:yes gene_type:complete